MRESSRRLPICSQKETDFSGVGIVDIVRVNAVWEQFGWLHLPAEYVELGLFAKREWLSKRERLHPVQRQVVKVARYVQVGVTTFQVNDTAFLPSKAFRLVSSIPQVSIATTLCPAITYVSSDMGRILTL